jgi:hypothetical protein
MTVAKIVGVGVHVIAGPRLTRTPVSTPIVRDEKAAAQRVCGHAFLGWDGQLVVEQAAFFPETRGRAESYLHGSLFFFQAALGGGGAS